MSTIESSETLSNVAQNSSSPLEKTNDCGLSAYIPPTVQIDVIDGPVLCGSVGGGGPTGPGGPSGPCPPWGC